MRLSEAILLGSTLMHGVSYCEILSGENEGCALDMACGKPGSFAFASKRWPWIWEVSVQRCPACNCGSPNVQCAIEHMSDWHVFRDGKMTLEQLVDWVRSVEPAELSGEDVNAVRLPEVSGNELSGERTQNTLSSDRQLSHK